MDNSELTVDCILKLTENLSEDDIKILRAKLKNNKPIIRESGIIYYNSDKTKCVVEIECSLEYDNYIENKYIDINLQDIQSKLYCENKCHCYSEDEICLKCFDYNKPLNTHHNIGEISKDIIHKYIEKVYNIHLLNIN